MTAESCCSYVEAVAEDSSSQRPTVFVSHWWGEAVYDFISCISRHQELRALPQQTGYWVCAYANNQHELGADIQADPRQTSFFRAMEMCTFLLLVLDKNGTPFTRVWCIFELAWVVRTHRDSEHTPLLLDIATAKKYTDLKQREHEAIIITHGLTPEEEEIESWLQGNGWYYKSQRESSFPIELAEKALALKIEHSEATVPVDRSRILNSITGASSPAELDREPHVSHAEYDRVNRQLRAAFAVHCWLNAVQVKPEILPLFTEALAADTDRKQLSLVFAGCQDFTDERLLQLSASLPLALKQLSLVMASCQHISLRGLGSLAKSFSTLAELADLEINLGSCPQVGDEVVRCLADGLPSGLVQLKLRFQHCDGISDSGLLQLASLLKLCNLRSILLNFSDCTQLTEGAVRVVAKSLPEALEKLELNFGGCPQVGDNAILAIVEALPVGLTRLVIRLRRCEQLSDEGLLHLGLLPRRLQDLELYCSGCKRIGNAWLKGLSAKLPVTLRQLKLDFARCEIGDDGMIALASGLNELMTHLSLCFSFCDAITDRGVQAIVKSLPRKLREGEFVFLGCSHLSSATRSSLDSILSMQEWQRALEEGNHTIASALPADVALVSVHQQAVPCHDVSDDTVLRTVLEVLMDGMDLEGHDFNEHSELFDYGFDSLSMMELRDKLLCKFPSVQMPATILFDFPTASQMAAYLTSALAKEKSLPHPVPDDTVLKTVLEVLMDGRDLEGHDFNEHSELFDSGFDSLLFDSLSMMELIDKLQGKFPTVQMPANFLFDFPTASQMAAYLTSALAKEKSLPHPVPDDAVLKTVLEVLMDGMDLEGHDFNEHSELFDYGFDSLSMMELRDKLLCKFPSVQMPATILFDFPTASQMAAYLTSALAKEKSLPHPVPDDAVLKTVLEVLMDGRDLEGHDFNEHSELFDYGFDSLSMMELRDKLLCKFPSVQMPATILFDFPTASQMAVYIKAAPSQHPSAIHDTVMP
ncbi:unnamed protein product [Polarella glacialis]|uniref:Carrier domain-containing protein n=1 Tax=Polarella glacialis TaxID=89957 RepID=A0A813JLE7_POLGL|nr:unnamed protein product [Polarella glacialis]